MADQVVVLTEDAVRYPIARIKWDWLSATDGTVVSATANAYEGKVVRCTLQSDSGGTAPTNLYDVTITDGDEVDILSGGGANVTAAATVSITDPAKTLYVRTSALELNIANAGDVKGGIVILDILRAV